MMICVTCHELIQTGDATLLDYHFGPEFAEKRMADFKASIKTMPADLHTLFTGEKKELASDICDCCHDPLRGDRYAYKEA